MAKTISIRPAERVTEVLDELKTRHKSRIVRTNAIIGAAILAFAELSYEERRRKLHDYIRKYSRYGCSGLYF